MDGRALRYVPALIALARERHFGRAAVALGLSQSVVSRQIAELESALGFMLVKRSTRQVELTPAGDRLVAGLTTGLA
ncbi:LysR family transcriptional regulator, partial [Acinetobacter baumannii]